MHANHTHPTTTRAEKTCIVKSKNAQVKIKKRYTKDKGISVEIDSGFEIKDDASGCQVVTRNGRIVAYIYEKRKEAAAPGMAPGVSASMAMGMSYFKSPMGLFVEKMSEEDLELTLSVIATANDRLIRTAMLDIYG